MSALPACSTRVGWCVSVAVCVCVCGGFGVGVGVGGSWPWCFGIKFYDVALKNFQKSQDKSTVACILCS